MTREIIEAYRFIVIPYVVNKLKKFNYEGKGVSDAKEFMSDFNEIFDLAIKALEQEPRKGHWIEEFVDTEGEVRFTCSCCGKYQLFGTDFCYNCGAKMDLEEENGKIAGK